MRLIFRGLVVIFMVLLLYAVQRVNVMRLGYEIEDLKKEGKHLEQIHNSLLIEKAALTSMERIEKIATLYLDMKQPGDKQIVFVKETGDGKSAPAPAKAKVTQKEAHPTLSLVKYFDWKL